MSSKPPILTAFYNQEQITIKAARLLEGSSPKKAHEFTCEECGLKLSTSPEHEGKKNQMIQMHFEHYRYVEGQTKCLKRDRRGKGNPLYKPKKVSPLDAS